MNVQLLPLSVNIIDENMNQSVIQRRANVKVILFILKKTVLVWYTVNLNALELFLAC